MIEPNQTGASKKVLMLVSLLISVSGLLTIYFASAMIEPRKVSLSDITADMEGRKISTMGYVAEKKNHPDGHLFLTISDNHNEIDVPLFSQYLKALNGTIGKTEEDFHVGGRIAVRGVLEIYKNNFQIIPRNIDDVIILVDDDS